MSIELCPKCDLEYDTDFFEECPYHDETGEKHQCDFCQEMKYEVAPIVTGIGDADICEQCRQHPEKWGPA